MDDAQTRKRGPAKLRPTWIAAISLAVGLLPIASNVASDAVARSLGCYIAEFSVYSRSGTYDDTSDDVPGCKAGSTDISRALERAHTFGLAFAITWPLVLLSLVLWAILLVRRVRKWRC
jgi:hypothetical protein